MIRILCVDDHWLIREGLARSVGVQPDMTVVAEASNGAEAIEQYQRHRPDVTLMDLQMPGMGGVEATRGIRAVDPQARIVVLTMYDGNEDVHRALQAGAVGYLLKDAVPDELIKVVREVHAGQRSIPPEIAAVLALRANTPNLTDREIQVLELLAQGMRNKEIGAALEISSETANSHVKSIFSKLKVHDRTAALTVAVRRGIIRIG